LTGENGKVPIGVGGKVDISFTSIGGCPFENEFTITDVDFMDDPRNKRIVIIQMEDSDSISEKSAFINKGYPEKEYTEVVKDHRKEMGLKKELIVAKNKDQKKSNIVIPAHKSGYEVHRKLAKENGYEYIKDINNHYLVHNSHKKFDKLKKSNEVFEYDVKNSFQIHRVLQYNIKGFNIDALLKSIPTRITSNRTKDVNANIKDKQKDPIGSGDDYTKDTKISNAGKISDIKFKGEKQSHQNNDNKTQTYNPLKGLNSGSIWVPGVNRERIGFKVDLVFPKPIGYEAIGDSDMYSTTWEVYAVRYKLIKTYFIQELFIRKPGKET
jgi:hypothetical protein